MSDFRDEVHSLLLGEELLRLPERFAQFANKVDDFITAQKGFNAQVSIRLDGVETRLDRVETRLQQVTDDLGDLKGHVAGRIAREIADDIAERFGYEMLA